MWYIVLILTMCCHKIIIDMIKRRLSVADALTFLHLVQVVEL